MNKSKHQGVGLVKDKNRGSHSDSETFEKLITVPCLYRNRKLSMDSKLLESQMVKPSSNKASASLYFAMPSRLLSINEFCAEMYDAPEPKWLDGIPKNICQACRN